MIDLFQWATWWKFYLGATIASVVLAVAWVGVQYLIRRFKGGSQ